MNIKTISIMSFSLFLSGCVGPCAPMWARWNGEAELDLAQPRWM